MTPTQAIAALDRQLTRHGQDVVLRQAGQPDRPLRAFVRGYRPEELSGGIQQGDRLAILSPMGLGVTVRRNDKLLIAGRVTNVEVANPVLLENQQVRIELTVRG